MTYTVAVDIGDIVVQPGLPRVLHPGRAAASAAAAQRLPELSPSGSTTGTAEQIKWDWSNKLTPQLMPTRGFGFFLFPSLFTAGLIVVVTFAERKKS